VPDKVTLSLVWSFTCLKCQHVNYHNGTAKGISPEDRKAATEALGDGDLVSIPEKVWCAKCEQQFDVDLPDES